LASAPIVATSREAEEENTFPQRNSRLNEEVGTFEFDLFFLLNYQHTPNHISDPGFCRIFFELLSAKS